MIIPIVYYFLQSYIINFLINNVEYLKLMWLICKLFVKFLQNYSITL